jgi:hypothetical protein
MSRTQTSVRAKRTALVYGRRFPPRGFVRISDPAGPVGTPDWGCCRIPPDTGTFRHRAAGSVRTCRFPPTPTLPAGSACPRRGVSQVERHRTAHDAAVDQDRGPARYVLAPDGVHGSAAVHLKAGWASVELRIGHQPWRYHEIQSIILCFDARRCRVHSRRRPPTRRSRPGTDTASAGQPSHHCAPFPGNACTSNTTVSAPAWRSSEIR